MKKERVIIGILLVTVAVMGYFLYLGRGHHGYDTIDNVPQELKSEEDCLFEGVNLTKNDGEAVDSIDARASIDKYDKTRFRPDILAYHVGLETLREMVAQADSFNSKVFAYKDSIIGYRFYNCVTDRDIPNLKNKKDLVASPTQGNNNDFFNMGFNSVGFVNEDLKLFTKFRPCPRICG